jgi:lipopolysaccharide transport system permease protein
MTTRLQYLDRIWKMRYFWFSLVKNDVANRYKKSFLGVGWSLVRPLALTFLFCVVFGSLFNLDVADYAPHLLIGMTVWQFFTECLNQGCHCFSGGSAYIRQQQIPLAIFPLRIVLNSAFHLLIALGLSLMLTLLLRGSLNPVALLGVIPALILLFFLGWCLAILSGITQTHFPDTQHVLELGLQFVFYLTPIVYRVDILQDRARFLWVVEWNPLTSLLAMFRTPILEGTAPHLRDIAISVVVLMATGLLAVTLLKRLERNLVFWV